MFGRLQRRLAPSERAVIDCGRRRPLCRHVLWSVVRALDRGKREGPRRVEIGPGQALWHEDVAGSTVDYEPLLRVAVSGSRLGEILGLQWQDVDFEHGALNVRVAR